MKTSALCLVALLLCGCVSITPRAQKIRLLPADSEQLAACTKLGPIDAEASAMGQINTADLDSQAQNNLRDAAASRWNGSVDTVALVSVDHATTKATAHGIAYQCASR